MKAPELKEQLEESEKLIQEMTVTWEEKLRKTEAVAQVGLSSSSCSDAFTVEFSHCPHASILVSGDISSVSLYLTLDTLFMLLFSKDKYVMKK